MRILLVDDHPLFLDGLKTLLTVQGMTVAGTAGNGREAFEKARDLNPDIILMDIQMPDLDGLAATRLIKAQMSHVKIVVLTMSHDSQDLLEAIKSGASGYLLKTEDSDSFFQRLDELMSGEVHFSSALADRVLGELVRETQPPVPEKPEPEKNTPLTSRQVEVLRLVAQGLTYKEAGARLFISERTVKYHMGEIVERLQLANKRQAVAYARDMKLTNPQT